MSMVKDHTKTTVRLDAKNAEALEAYSRARGESINSLINRAISEYLVHDSKVRTLITAQSRLREQMNQNERIILTMFQTMELFFEKFFILAEQYSPEELRRRVGPGRANFEAFVEEALKHNRNSGMPTIIERINAQLTEQGEKELA